MNSYFCFLAKQMHVHLNVFSALLMLLPHSRNHSWYYCDPLPRYCFIVSAVAHNINNKPASNQRKQKLGGLFRNVFIDVWLRLGFFVSKWMSVEFSRNTIIPDGKFDVAGEKVRLIKREKQFLLEKLSEARIDNASNYGRKIGVKSS